ncbi:hypothetical protein BSKO_03451 [Bryopsis sp. KO-2023]|nr:hypothetical protein BSKO_03451 [Bryopsis sp. KO-2023]
MRNHVCSLARRLGSAGRLSGEGAWASTSQFQQTAGLATNPEDLKKTPLHDFHVKNGGKMVDFAGWSMPLQYDKTVMESSKHCRSDALVFDVAHMCGLSLKGKDAVPFLEKLVVGDVGAMKAGTGSLTVFTNEKGGIIDDSVITKVADDDIYVVVNAGRRDVDLAHIQAHLDKNSSMDVGMTVHDDRGLLALQGPKAAGVLQKMTDFDLSKLFFGMFTKTDVGGVPVWITRTGYTGEDGFELSIPGEGLETLASKMIANPEVWLGGLGARDALRLEAGLCLYGNDITEATSPIEAGLTWTIAKSRRAECSFIGGEAIKKQLADGVSRRRVGLLVKGAPARDHSAIVDADGKEVGEVTSGAFSPNLGKPIAMGYVNKPHDKKDTKLKVVVRGRSQDATITKMPFVPAKYFKG